MSNDYYHDASIAAAYDAECAEQAVTIDDIPFYVELAKEAASLFPLSVDEEGEPLRSRGRGSVLELGCGTGRVTLPIAQAGVDIVGIDSSAEMLDIARSKAASAKPPVLPTMPSFPGEAGMRSEALQGGVSPRWLQADMANFQLDERFGLAIIPFRSFLLLLTVEAQKSCLRRIHEHLLPGGRLALNFFNPDLALMASWLTDKRDLWQRERSYTQRELWAKRRVSTADQHVEGLDAHVELSDAGAVIARIERNLRLRYVFRYEMEHLLELTGFEVEALYGWFDRRPFNDQSSEMVWLARKP